MRKLGFALCGVFLLLTSGCAPKVPDWIAGHSPNYPEDAWLIGVGSAEKRQDAEDRARAALARIFSVSIQSTQSSSESVWLNRLASGERSGYEQKASSKLITTTNRILTGARIAEVWEKQPREIYALAVLDRSRAAHPLRQELADIDLAISNDLTSAKKQTHAIERLASYLRALQRYKRRDQLAADLAILVPSGYVVAAPASAAEVAGWAEKTAADIRLDLKLAGDEKGVVEGAMISALAKLGLVPRVNQPGDMQIDARIQLEPYQGNGPLHWVMATVETRFLLPDGQPLDALRKSVREGSQVESRARILALEKIGDALATAVVQKLFSLGSAGLN